MSMRRLACNDTAAAPSASIRDRFYLATRSAPKLPPFSPFALPRLDSNVTGHRVVALAPGGGGDLCAPVALARCLQRVSMPLLEVLMVTATQHG